jgi:hypothetical protein
VLNQTLKPIPPTVLARYRRGMAAVVRGFVDVAPFILCTGVLIVFAHGLTKSVQYANELEFWWLRRRARAAQPTLTPIEQVAADVRRVRRSLMLVPPRAPAVRVRGLYLAYDDVLMEAADILDVPHQLEHLPLGPDRDLERLQLEAGLEHAGLLLDR